LLEVLGRADWEEGRLGEGDTGERGIWGRGGERERDTGLGESFTARVTEAGITTVMVGGQGGKKVMGK
jgi:hypothetical protein